MKLSIVTINFNNKIGLIKTIHSVVEQTWRDFEWIIIDGGSDDGSYLLIEQLSKRKDLNVSYWCSEKDNGVYHAFNKGIKHCSGEYISFLNSGDVYYSSKTLDEVFAIQHKADILYGDWVRASPDHSEILNAPASLGIFDLYKNNICHQAMFIRTDLFLKDSLFDESYNILADYKRWIDAALSGASFEYLNTVVCVFETGGMSDTQNDIRLLEYDKIIKSYPEAVLRSLKMCEIYEEALFNPYIKKARRIIDNGGVRFALYRAILKLLS